MFLSLGHVRGSASTGGLDFGGLVFCLVVSFFPQEARRGSQLRGSRTSQWGIRYHTDVMLSM